MRWGSRARLRAACASSTTASCWKREPPTTSSITRANRKRRSSSTRCCDHNGPRSARYISDGPQLSSVSVAPSPYAIVTYRGPRPVTLRPLSGPERHLDARLRHVNLSMSACRATYAHAQRGDLDVVPRTDVLL